MTIASAEGGGIDDDAADEADVRCRFDDDDDDDAAADDDDDDDDAALLSFSLSLPSPCESVSLFVVPSLLFDAVLLEPPISVLSLSCERVFVDGVLVRLIVII